MSFQMLRRIASSSTSSNNHCAVHSKTIGPNIKLWYKTASDSDPPRHLVLLYPWLVAKEKHKKKYTDFYLDKGFDVLHVTIQPQQFLWPKYAHAISRKVVDLLQTHHTMQHQQIVVHAFSIGAYLYSEAMVRLLADPGAYSSVIGRIRGHIYDSPVGLEGAREGLPKALTKNKAVIALASAGIASYLKIFSHPVTRHLKHAEVVFRANSMAVPTLFLYSLIDPVCNVDSIDRAIRDMERQKTAPIFSKTWPDSTHVSHMLLHPREYTGTVNMFLDRCGLNGQSDSDREQAVAVK